MERAKTIDEIYSEVKDYDLVITNDAALSTALNARIDRAIVGYFAMTPKQIAGIEAFSVLNEDMMRDLKVISSICDETGLDFKFVHGELENIKFIRNFTKDVGKYLHGNNSKLVYESFSALPTQIKVMSEFHVEGSELLDTEKKRIAIIAPELFNDLDKSFNDSMFDVIDPFVEDEEFSIDTIYEIGNDRQLAENAASLIDPSRASDYAIVVNTASPITDAVRSSLYRRGLPFINSLSVKDLSQVRDYLQFLNLSLGYDTLRVKHVREIFSNYNATLNARSDDYLLSRLDDRLMSPKAKALRDLMRDVRQTTYLEALDILKNPGQPQVKMLLDDMGYSDNTIDDEGVNKMTYAVNNVSDLHHNQEIPENERAGVLVTDCNNSVYIDRPVVIFLGMEQDWNMTLPSKPYIDPQDQTEINVTRLKILLQQGSRRIYCVNTTKRGKKARPSMLFDELFAVMDQDYHKVPVKKDTFDKICDNLITGRWTSEREVIIADKGETVVEPDSPEDNPFSKSSFNAYFKCPRAYMFNALIPFSDKKATEFGNLIHSFAELYFSHRDFVKEKGVDYFIDLISENYMGLSSPLMVDLDRDRIRLAMNNVVRYIDGFSVDDPPLDVYNNARTHPNRFMERLDLKMTSSLCETPRVSKSCPMHGEFDLYCANTITDYKTGKANSIKEISQKMLFEDNGNPEFQPLMYLSIARSNGDENVAFNQFYVLGNDVDSLNEGFDVSNNVRSIRIEEGSLMDCFFSSEEVRDQLDRTLSKAMSPYRDQILQAIQLSENTDPSSWRNDQMITAVMNCCSLKDTTTNRKNIGGAISKVAGIIAGRLIATDNVLIVPTETLEDFNRMVDEMHSEAMEGSRTGFPAEPKIECKNCDFYKICTAQIVSVEGGEVNESE